MMGSRRAGSPGLARLVVVAAGLAALGGPAACARRQPEPAPGAADTTATTPAPELPIDVMPRLVEAPIEYPPAARERGRQGLVQVRALVGADGAVSEAAVLPGQDADAELSGAAVAAVRRWTFEPARRGGEPVAVWIVVPVNFRLH